MGRIVVKIRLQYTPVQSPFTSTSIPIPTATMSWAGFKKNVNRATTQVMMKTGHVEKTNDRDYEVEERRYRTMEAASMRLQKEAKGYLDSLRAMTASQMRIAETIDAFYGDAGAKDGVSRSYKQAVEDLDAETQTPRLRRDASKGQETRREARQGCHQAPACREGNGDGKSSLRATKRATLH